MNFKIKSFSEYESECNRASDNPEGFWSSIADHYSWQQKWDQVLDWNFTEPNVKWFLNGKLNITENCIDRHLAERADKTAILWESNFPDRDSEAITYQQLHYKVAKAANGLKSLGVKKGDRVCLYMPMIPELAIAVLACARIGAIHSVVFAGFSAQALADRINDATCNIVITSDGLYRGAKTVALKAIVDLALEQCTCVKSVLVKKCTSDPVAWEGGRDYWWDELMDQQSASCPAEQMDSEDPLFILYTSGSTGKPKGVVHTCGGYMVYAGYSFANVFQYDEEDVYWCTADIGWITGHTYIVYGPLLNGATTMMFEGVPTWPDGGRFWEIVEKHKVNQFYTAPTAIRALMTCGEEVVNRSNLSSLKVIGTVGEPINHEAWEWYKRVVGDNKVPIVDTWWQTETGGIMISGLGGHSPQKATFAGYPLPGIQPCLVTPEGKEITENGVEGLLCIKHPWPSIIRTTYGDHERCRVTYFSSFEGMYFTGDGARRDENGMYRIIGRVDDVINVSGHRFGTAEIENAINETDFIVESAVVGYPHDIKGQGIYAYVICDKPISDFDQARKDITAMVVQEIGPIAKPDKIQFVVGLPKTRSGKIMRRILRKVAEGEPDKLGDTSTLLDPAVVEDIVKGAH
ncbi:MAG: acetate--CoA ligase [Flavobacteriales bacterium]|jgi:acetyl-CoA synthetase|nr:acetate--CoA ligase [Flavobacteriales bacterium]